MNSFTSSVRQTKRFLSSFPIPFHYSESIVGDWPDWLIVRRRMNRITGGNCRCRNHHQRAIIVIHIAQDVVGQRWASQRDGARRHVLLGATSLFIPQNAMRKHTKLFRTCSFSHRQLATIASIIFNGFRTEYALAYLLLLLLLCESVVLLILSHCIVNTSRYAHECSQRMRPFGMRWQAYQSLE